MFSYIYTDTHPLSKRLEMLAFISIARARVEDSRDIRVVHDRQRLAFVGEAGQYLVRVHTQFDDLDRYTAANALVCMTNGSSARPASSITGTPSDPNLKQN
jgi:hypothetical protein